jgi:peptidoglycan/xylan/chitin deacetylase (PgdA/CDA1 family)
LNDRPTARGDWSRLSAWSPSPLARASLWLHGASAAALALQPTAWPGLLALLAGNHAVLACAMHPRGSLLGPNMTRLPEPAGGAVALTFDDGPHPEVTPRVLDILDAHGARATFFTIGERAARHGPLMRDILRRGHGIGNHSHRHPLAFACWGPWRLRREIAEAQAAIADACGLTPRFFRAPMGLRSPLLDPVLAVEGLSLVSWSRRGYDAVSRHPDQVLRRLTRGLTEGDILLLHDATSRLGPRGRPVVLDVLPKLLRSIAAAGLATALLPEWMQDPAGTGGGSGATAARADAPASRTPAGHASR